MKGSVYKRCTCPVERNEKGARLACKKNHGSWFYVADAGVNLTTGKRRQVKKGGFASKTDAQDALAAAVDSAAKGMVTDDERQTVAAFLTGWLANKERAGLRPTTMKSYRQHVEQYIVPVIGGLRLRDVRPGHIDKVLVYVTTPRPGRRAVGPTSVRPGARHDAQRVRLGEAGPTHLVQSGRGHRPTAGGPAEGASMESGRARSIP